MRLANRVAVVTGATGGLGLIFCKTLAKHGATVVLTDITEEGLANAAKEMEAAGCKYATKRMDVSDKENVTRVMKEVAEQFGRIDILVNNAGGSLFTPKKLEEIEEQHWDKVLNVNLKGAFFCCQAAAPYMIRQKYGKIINLASIGGRTASIVTGVAYAAAKGGIMSFTRRLALELAPYNITVNAIAPGTVLSGQRMINLWNELSPEEKAKNLASIPMGRQSTGEEQADGVLFLASDESSYITGVILDINGGRLMA